MKVLLPVDDSEACGLTLEWVSGFLDKQSARLHILHVVDERLGGAVQAMETGEVEALLLKASRMLEEKGFVVEKVSYEIGYPPDKIREYADQAGVMMIIMGANGKKGLGKLLMGSVSSEVFKTAHQQVLILNNTPRPSLTIPLGSPQQLQS